MVDVKYISLMNKDIDSEISPEDKNLLHIHLNENPEAKKIYEELLIAVHAFEDVTEVEPPKELQAEIIKQIDPSLYARHDNTNKKTFKIRFWPKEGNLKFVYAAAAGLIIGFILYPLMLFPPIAQKQNRIQDITATIGIQDSENARIVQSESVSLEALGGSIDLKRTEKLSWLEFNLSSLIAYDVNLAYNPAEMRFVSLHPVNPDKMRFEHISGHIHISAMQPFALFFIPQTASNSILTLKVSTDLNTSQDLIFEVEKKNNW
jgi:hypothetical protein